MKLSANQASKEAGIAKKTLLEAIKSKRMSAEKNDKGHWEIDTSELFRVFPKTGGSLATETDTHPHQKPHENGVLQAELKADRRYIERLEAEIDDLKAQRDEWMGQAKTLAITSQKGQGGKRGFLERMFGR